MQPVIVSVRQIGNSHGFVVPKVLLSQVGLEDSAEMTVEKGALVLRPPSRSLRAGWQEAAQALAAVRDDALVLGEFPNAGDENLAW